MEAMEARLLERLAKLDGIADRVLELGDKLNLQAGRLDQVQMKVDLSMEKLGKLEADQISSMRAAERLEQLLSLEKHRPAAPPPPASGDGIIGPCPATAPQLQVTTFQPSGPSSPESSARPDHVRFTDMSEETPVRRQWMPRMDFPRFDGTDASIWVDTCETFFELYQIAPGFQVSAATMYLSEYAAHWYHAFKRTHERLTWEQFRQAVLLEFDMDTHRVKMTEL